MVVSAMAVELQEQLFAQEKELGSREGVLMAREHGQAAFEHALERTRMECDGECN
jgi:hypothetical protein